MVDYILYLIILLLAVGCKPSTENKLKLGLFFYLNFTLSYYFTLNYELTYSPSLPINCRLNLFIEYRIFRSNKIITMENLHLTNNIYKEAIKIKPI